MNKVKKGDYSIHQNFWGSVIWLSAKKGKTPCSQEVTLCLF